MSSTSLVRPFRALHPASGRAADVIAPPYDVVSTDEARALASGRPASFLHISRPEIDLPPGTLPYADATYAQGAKNLAQLCKTDVLVRDSKPAFYVYRMTMNGHVQTGVGLVASVAAYDASRIRRHELTRPDKENDRVRNIEALNAQTGPVLLAYRKSDILERLIDEATQKPALLETIGPNEVLHSVWRVGGTMDIANLSAAFEKVGTLYIADGHHRSAAASRVAAARRKAAANERTTDGAGGSGASAAPSAAGAPQSADFFLAVAYAHDEMRILDYNRIVRDLNGLTPEKLLQRIGGAFTVEPSAKAVRPERPEVFGMHLAGHWYRLTIREACVPRSDPVASLDVSLLQNFLLGPVLGIGDPRTDARIDFVGGIRGTAELERRVASGEAAVAFALHPTRMEQLMAVADAGKLMPPKSTWFEPKLADGLLSHVLD